MRNNSASLIAWFYILIIGFYCIFPFLEIMYQDSSNLPWDYARITDVDYTAKILDEPDKRW